MNSAIETLSQSIPQQQIKTDAESIKFYGKDWTTYFDIKATAVVFPRSTEDVQKLVQWARKNKISLIPSGGRTGLSGAAVATQGEVIVSFEQMNKIISLNKIEQTVVVQPGVVTEALQKYALDNGYYFPVDFASRGSSQIGGNIATNAGGIKVIRYGLMREWVASLKVVTGAGEIMEFNKSLIKNATGYDFRHLFIGSEGTLGFITEATIRLANPPPPLKVMVMAVQNLDAVMEVFGEFKKQTTLTAFEMYSEKALKHVTSHTGLARPVETVSEYYVMAEIECPDDQAEDKILGVFEACLEKNLVLDGTLSQSETQAKNFWRLREDITEACSRFSPYKNDISVSISKVPNFMRDLDAVLTQHYPNYEVIWFGHIGDGNLHISILRPDGMTKEAFVKECRKVDELLFGMIRKYEGSISAEHGVGLTKKSFLNFTRSEAEIQLMRQVKKIFDPDGIINPGKVFDL